MDNPEILSTLGTLDTGQITVRENRRVNQEWTIRRYCQHWAHKIQDEDKQNNTETPKYKQEKLHPKLVPSSIFLDFFDGGEILSWPNVLLIVRRMY